MDGRLNAGHDGGRRLAEHKTLLVGADGGADHFRRQVEIGGLEFAHQHDRPFDQARDLVEQPFVLDQRQPLRERQVLGVGEDDRLAPLRVEYDLGLLQGVDVVVETADTDRRWSHEAMAKSQVSRFDAVDLERDDVGGVVRDGQSADDSAQRAHPPKRVGPGRRCAPAHRFRPRKRAHDCGDDLGDRVLGLAARLLDQRDVELALLRVGHDPRVFDPLEARALEKTLDRRVRRADAGPLALLAQIRLGGRQADDMQRQAPRGDEALRPLVEKVALDQGVGDEALEVLRRLSLHPGGDFFAEQFKQEVGHRTSFSNSMGRRSPFSPCGRRWTRGTRGRMRGHAL